MCGCKGSKNNKKGIIEHLERKDNQVNGLCEMMTLQGGNSVILGDENVWVCLVASESRLCHLILLQMWWLCIV